MTDRLFRLANDGELGMATYRAIIFEPQASFVLAFYSSPELVSRYTT